jgi:hypothetical protein
VGRSVAETEQGSKHQTFQRVGRRSFFNNTTLAVRAFHPTLETSLLRLRAASSLINTDFSNATHP